MYCITFYNELSSLVRNIPKHNVKFIRGYMNAKMGKDENNKLCLHNSSNRNEEHLTDFPLKNRQTCLNRKFQKREEKYGPTSSQIMLKNSYITYKK